MFGWEGCGGTFPFVDFRWLERCPSDSITGIILEGAQM